MIALLVVIFGLAAVVAVYTYIRVQKREWLNWLRLDNKDGPQRIPGGGVRAARKVDPSDEPDEEPRVT
jgi:hypothetical protein